MTITDWSTDPRVAPLLDELRSNPPQIIWSQVPSRSSLFGRDDVWTYASPSIDELHNIYNEYFLKLDAIDNEFGANVYMFAVNAFFDDQPSVADLVEGVEAQRVAA